MECIECGKKIGILDEVCPYCVENQYDEEVEVSVTNVSKNYKE